MMDCTRVHAQETWTQTQAARARPCPRDMDADADGACARHGRKTQTASERRATLRRNGPSGNRRKSRN
eukprot:10830230-Lingulodinium_polyedra.AAC.1